MGLFSRNDYPNVILVDHGAPTDTYRVTYTGSTYLQSVTLLALGFDDAVSRVARSLRGQRSSAMYDVSATLVRRG